MNIITIIKLIVAVCIALEIRPEDLARIFNRDDEVQKYFDILVSLQNDQTIDP